MKKFWLVFKYEYLRHVLRKRFLFGLLSVPLFIVVILGIGMISALLAIDNKPAGYVDQAGLLTITEVPGEEEGIFADPPLVAFPNEAAALEAIDRGEIGAFYVIPPDYLETGEVRVITREADSNLSQGRFTRLVRINLLAREDEAVAKRVLEGPQMILRSVDGTRETNESNFLSFLVPFSAGVLFMIAVNSSGGYLLQAVVEEKENRTMEIVITSVSPEQLMAGKVLGNLSVGLTQLFAWILFGVVGLWVAKNFFPFAENLAIDLTSVMLMLITLLPAFVMVAALMAMAGATATESSEAQQIAGLFSLPIVAPYWFAGSIMTNPNGPLATGLSLFPLTAPVALPMRAIVTNVPVGQVILAVVLLVLVALLALLLAARAFRLGMLRYGKRVTWGELFRSRRAVA